MIQRFYYKAITRRTKHGLIFSLIFGLVFSCSEGSEKKLTVKNPTNYIFNVSKSGLKEKLITSFDVFFFDKQMILYYKGGSRTLFDSLKIFEQHGNADDFYLEPHDFVKLKSHIYFKDGAALEYKVSFHLHLDSLSSERTRVTVNTIDPKILTGKSFLPSGPHLTRGSKYVKVAPSTIEEYEILFEIGKILQEPNMPPISYPNE